jgi:hypothetical protein
MDVATQVFRLKAEVRQSSTRLPRQPSEMPEVCVITHDLPLKPFHLQSIHLSSYEWVHDLSGMGAE